MAIHSSEEILNFMLQAARQTRTHLLGGAHRLTVATKLGDPKNIVTEADCRAEATIKQYLAPLTEFGMRGEEGTSVSGSKGMFFIDPLDGTIPFVSGMETYGVSIGLVQNGVPTFGVLYYPHDDWALCAAPHLKKNMLIPPSHHDGKAHNLVVGFDYSNGIDRWEQTLQTFMPIARGVRYPLTFACVTWAVRLLLEGKIDAYVHPGATWFDWAAAAAIIPASGGVVQNFEGGPLDFSKRRVPAIAARDAETLQLVKAVLKQERR